MFDGSELPLTENMDIAVKLLKECKELGIILEVEAGVVGGEEDGVSNEDAPADKLYTTPKICCMFTKDYPRLKVHVICSQPLSAMCTAFTNRVMLS